MTHSGPFTSAFRPYTRRSPASATSSTCARIAGLEADRRAGGNVQAKAARGGAVETAAPVLTSKK